MADRDALDTLEYPRHLHKGPVDYLIVDSLDAAIAALADGWTVDVDPKPEPVVVEPEKPKGKGKRS